MLLLEATASDFHIILINMTICSNHKFSTEFSFLLDKSIHDEAYAEKGICPRHGISCLGEMSPSDWSVHICER